MKYEVVLCGGDPTCGTLYPETPGQPFVGLDEECSACGAPAVGTKELIRRAADSTRSELGIDEGAPPLAQAVRTETQLLEQLDQVGIKHGTGHGLTLIEFEMYRLFDDGFLRLLRDRDPAALAAVATAARSFDTESLRRMERDLVALDRLLGTSSVDGDQRLQIREILCSAVGVELQRRQVKAGVLPA